MAGKKETVYHFLLTIVSKAITYVLLLVLANFFAPIDYGAASFAILIFSTITTFSFPGFTLLVSYIIKRHDVPSIFYFSFTTSLVLGTISIIASFFFPLLWPLVPCFYFAWLAGFSKSIMRSKHKYHWIQATELIFIVLNLVLTILLSRFSSLGIVTALSASTLIVAVLCVILVRADLLAMAKKFRIDLGVVKGYLAKSAYALFTVISFDFLGRSDALILGALSSFENVARYNVASVIAGLLNAISLSISMFLLTRGAELSNEPGEAVFKRSLRISFSLNLCAGILLASVVSIVLRFFFPKYLDVGLFVVVLASSALFYSAYFLYFTHLFARLQPEKVAKPVLIGAIVNFGLDFLLIPYFGVLGISLATLAAGVVTFVLCDIRGLGAMYFTVLFSPLLIFAAFFMHWLGILLLLPAFFILLRTNSLTRADIKVIYAVVDKIVLYGRVLIKSGK